MRKGSSELVKGNQARSKVLPVYLIEYGVALLSVGVALGTTFTLGSYLAPTPTSLFFIAVMVSAWYGGLGPGIVATVLSTLAIDYFLLKSSHALGIPNAGTLVRLGVFVVAALLINSLHEAQRTARRKAEANFQFLRESEARFGSLIESNIIGMIVAALDGEILDANRNFLELVGYTEEELSAGQLHWREMTAPESMESSEKAVQELLTTGVCTPFEKKYIRKDGSHVPVLHGAVVTGKNTVTGFVLDLSEHKRIEAIQQEAMRRERSLHAEVQAANSQLETVLASLNDQFLVLDREWRYIYVSDRVVEVVGRPKAELLGQCIWDVFPETVGSQFYQEVHRAVAEQKIAQFEYFYAPWQRWFENRVYPSAAGVSILVIDITERQRAEANLRDSEERLRLALAASKQGLFDLNVQTGDGLVSPAYAEMLGYDPENFQETNAKWRERLHPDDVDATYQAYQDYVSGKVDSYRAEFRLRTRSGDWKWILSIGKIVAWDDAGQPLRMIGTHTDINDLKQAEAEREQLLVREKTAREEAETANQIKDEFLAVLSHELRSPLNPILGWAQLLQTHKLDEERTKQALTTIERNAKLQTQLIEDLLDVSRILRGKLVLNIAPVSLISTIEAALETVRLAVEAKGIQIERVFTLELDQVMGDTARLQQVVWNLLSNAVKFTPPNGMVEIRLEQFNNFAQIQVRDSGKGISPKFLPYVFDYFRQADGTTTRKFGGLGLGLAIVRHITELHGGTVRAESQGEGLGATFTVQLPLIPVSVSVAEKDADLTTTNLTGLRILAVDDDEDIRELTEFILQQAGAEVRVVASATEALQQLQTFSPELLISDIGMPDFDGYMLMQQVRSLELEQKKIPAIALTAYAGELDQQQAIAAGFQMHLAKPIEPEKLIDAIVALCKKK